MAMSVSAMTGAMPGSNGLSSTTSHAPKMSSTASSETTPTTVSAAAAAAETLTTHKNAANLFKSNSQLQVDSAEVYATAAQFPRETLKMVEYGGLLPRLEAHINSTVEVRVPAHVVRVDADGVKKRAVWGTDVYTDDSDVVAMLVHLGLVGENEEDGRRVVRVQCVGTRHENAVVGNSTGEASANPESETVKIELSREDREAKLNKEGQIEVVEGGSRVSIRVTLLVLPRLERYTGSYRHGINSRSWLTRHDGVSIAVLGVMVVREQS